ncbi:MAG: YaaL family protein [Alicyclobacillus herbarius]|uniref:YaaL family protein n=1 Tax=Alicyclobacillus herbarius TaxID=122960 RepID=UPI000417EFF0|nr:YaaL family protein [Alicyclobacillus herbarius]MCL6633042.1 YaaL family protein [Alicyclobacillus herbarius]
MKENTHHPVARGFRRTRPLTDADGQLDAGTLIHELVMAKREMELAQSQFDHVVDPCLIDHTVFRMGAAEQHFRYLLNLAREQQIHVGSLQWLWAESDTSGP